MNARQARQITLRGMFILVTAIAAWLGLSLVQGALGFLIGGVLCSLSVVYFYVPRYLCWPWITELAVVLAISVVLILRLLPVVDDARDGTPNYRGHCANNLKQIGYALQNYYDLHGSYPPLVTYSASGRPMHSWRTHILPFIERQDLAEQYDWTEPWNGPLNSRIDLRKNPVFQCPLDPAAKKGGISYIAIDVPGAKAGNPFVVIEVHGSGIGFFEPRDLLLDDMFAMKPSAKSILPSGMHGVNRSAVQLVWPDAHVELIPVADLPKRLAELRMPQSESP
jgi:hypothetical protein